DAGERQDGGAPAAGELEADRQRRQRRIDLAEPHISGRVLGLDLLVLHLVDPDDAHLAAMRGAAVDAEPARERLVAVVGQYQVVAPAAVEDLDPLLAAAA